MVHKLCCVGSTFFWKLINLMTMLKSTKIKRSTIAASWNSSAELQKN